MASKKDVYFGKDEPEALVAYLQQRSSNWFQALSTSDYLDKIKRSWQAYHGIYYEDNHTVSFGGETGELVNVAVNHYRNIAENIHTMVTSSRPAFQARAINTDLTSQIQTNLANGLLDYYMRDKRLEDDLKRAVKYAIVMGTGYIKMEWNSTTGQVYDYIEPELATQVDPLTGEEAPVVDEETGEQKVLREGYPVYEGDVEFTVLSPFDVVFDTTKESPKQDWQLCRSFKNKFDLAAKFPEHEDDIVALKTKSDVAEYRISLSPFDETVDVPVYEFFHRPTESLPKGRYVLYLSEDIILIDTVLPYRKLPIFRISPADILGTPFGYTTMFDLLPIQESVNSLYSTILTNQHAFGVQNIVAERDSGLTIAELSSGMNLVEINPGSKPPAAMQLLSTPTEIFSFLSTLERQMEVISGINSVARGNPDPSANLRSGTALALIQSQALQFISGLQQSYIQLIEDVGTNLVTLLQDFASVPRIAQISGKSNTTYMKEFSGSDLSDVVRVIVDAGNALAQTTAGRTEMATQLIQMGLIKSPEQYMSVISTGKLESMTESQNKQLLLIRAENERMIDGKVPVMAVLTDEHVLHIKEHQAVLADPDLRMNADLVHRALTHIQEHINILSDPNVASTLQTMGQQPIAPTMPPQGQGGPAPQTPASPELPQGGDPSQLMSNPQAQDVSTQQQASQMQPNVAQPPQPFQDVPQTGAELYAQNTGGAKPSGGGQGQGQ
jgi:hypothetical protein